MGDLDDHALSLMLEIESVEPGAAAARERVAALRMQLAQGEERLAGEVGRLAAELPVLCDERAGAAAKLPAGLVKQYEALRPRRAGTAVAALVDGKCGGCRMVIPYIMVRDIRSGLLRTCDTCGRIVVEPE
jgi:predicted  nucleic acid-binding Zn-ribbon protein